MKIASLFGVWPLLAAIVGASPDMLVTQMPRAEPTSTFGPDPWQCVTENITQYIDVPKPTGSLLTALDSYGDKLIETCTPTETAFTALPSCPFPAKSLWCGFTTAIPSTMLSAYSSYGKSASSWLAAKSSAMASVTQQCPSGWSKMLMETPGSEAWLNLNIAFAGCYADAHPTTASSTTKSSLAAGSIKTSTTSSISLASATTRSGTTGAVSPSPTSTKAPNVGRMQGVEMWMMASTGLAAAAANSVW
ncbi:hypothetical protein BKA65DRAFT_567394 [Rhexocercosporidium sp. MPI-PUGE-AT-0058]|nr:hypothetical protein BKA65DRAFT_567394 [Rhexocercosporidium sp. MPI-PUGE-AT-0058]